LTQGVVGSLRFDSPPAKTDPAVSVYVGKGMAMARGQKHATTTLLRWAPIAFFVVQHLGIRQVRLLW